MPSQVVNAIDDLFPHAKTNVSGAKIPTADRSKLIGIIELIRLIPGELIFAPSKELVDLVLAKSMIEHLLSREGQPPHMLPNFKDDVDLVTILRRTLAKCSDEYPPPQSVELNMIQDADLRESIRNDIGAASRAILNDEWKAATVLAGAAIEALLHWVLSQRAHPPANLDDLMLGQLLVEAEKLGRLKPNTITEVKLAKDFRNLIHHGRTRRLSERCDRGMAYAAIAALDHVIRDLT
jgi:hypothetical protein